MPCGFPDDLKPCMAHPELLDHELKPIVRRILTVGSFVGAWFTSSLGIDKN
jgi:hypothetical protein